MTAESVCRALGGQRQAGGGYLVRCPVPSHGRGRGDRNVSLSIKDGDQRLLVRCHAGCASRDVLDELRRRSLLDEAPYAAERARKDYAARDLASARRIVRELVPIRGTLGETYLAKVRKIDIASIADVLQRTDAIGWHSGVYFNSEGHELHGSRLGVIIGIMTDPVTARPTGAVSRTYLGSDGAKIGKAKTLGCPQGIVRLSCDEDVAEGLHLAEGLETALTGMSIGLRPMWSTGSTSLMAKFPVLSGIECLTVIADHDPGGGGEAAAHEVANRWRGADRKARILRPATCGDLNDLILKETPR